MRIEVRRAAALHLDPGDLVQRLLDLMPSVRTPAAPEKHRAALKAFVIGLNARLDRAPGLRAFDHDHPHVILPLSCVCSIGAFVVGGETGRLDEASYRCGGGLGGGTGPAFWGG